MLETTLRKEERKSHLDRRERRLKLRKDTTQGLEVITFLEQLEIFPNTC